MEEGEKEEREPGSFVNARWRVFLYIGVGLLALVWVPGVSGIMRYLIGTTAEVFVFVGMPMGFVVWLGLAARQAILMRGAGSLGHAARCAVVVGVSTAALTLALPFATGGGEATQTMGLWCRMKTLADVEGIRQWGEKVELKEKAGGETEYAGELPECIRVLKPERVRVETETRAVTLEWSAKGFGRWGLWVGPREGERPTGLGYTMRVGAGAWVWDRE